MSRDQLSGSSDDRATRPGLLGLEPDQIEAARLAEVLTAIERGRTPDLDPVEDPALVSLAATAHTLRSSLEAASARASFGVFHERSRVRVLAATPRPRRQPVVTERRESLLQRWNGLFTSLSAAAAASVATFVVTVLAVGGGSTPVPLASVQMTDDTPEPAVSAIVQPVEAPQNRVNLTALSINEQVTHYVGLLERLNALSVEGLPADEQLLRDLADTGATVKRGIKNNPEVTGADAFVAMLTTFKGQQVLETATVASDEDLQILTTAQETAEDAYVTAAQYLSEPNRLPSADEAERALVAATTQPATEPAASEPEFAP